MEAMQQIGELDDALKKTQQLLMSYQSLQGKEEELSKRVQEESLAHAKTRAAAIEADRAANQRLAALDSERVQALEAHAREHQSHTNTRMAHDVEVAAHADTRAAAKARLDSEMAAHQVTREALDRAKAELAELQKSASEQLGSLQQENEMLRAQARSYEERCTATNARLFELEKDNETIHQAHAVTKSSLQSALQAQEAYRKEYHTTHQELNNMRSELQATRDELMSKTLAPAELEEAARLRGELEMMTRMHEETKLQMDSALEETKSAMQNVANANQALQDREQQLNQTKAELETTKVKAHEICKYIQNGTARLLSRPASSMN